MGLQVLHCTPRRGFHGVEKNRVPALCRAFGITTEALAGKWITVGRTINLSDPQDVDAVIEAHSDFRPDILPTDTLATAIPGLNENDASTASKLTGNTPVGKLRRTFDAALPFVHHTGKDESKGARGSSAFLGNADWAWEIKEGKGQDTVELLVEKMKDGPAKFSVFYRIEWWSETGQVQRREGVPVDGVPVARRITEAEYAALKASAPREEDSGAVTVPECAKALRRLGAGNYPGARHPKPIENPILADEIIQMRQEAERLDTHRDTIMKYLRRNAATKLAVFSAQRGGGGGAYTWFDRCPVEGAV